MSDSYRCLGNERLIKMMRLKENLKLRKIGNRYMIVEAGEAVDLTNVYTLNATAAWLWEEAEGRDFTVEELVRKLCARYEVDEQTALADVSGQIAQWEEFGLLSR